MKTKLSESAEDYLEAIGELIAIEGHAHAKKIADRIGVRMPSVTVALRRLAEQGYIVYATNYPVELTPAGKRIAAQVIHRHMILSRFFAEVLGLPAKKAGVIACHLEHIVDADTVARFDALIQRLSGGKKGNGAS